MALDTGLPASDLLVGLSLSPQSLWESCLRGSGELVILFLLAFYSQGSFLGDHTPGPQTQAPLIPGKEPRGQHPSPMMPFPTYLSIPTGRMATKT